MEKPKIPTTEFFVKKTEIPGLLEIDISLIEDARGWFQEKFQREKLVALGFPSDFAPVQHSVSFNKEAGVTRGLHAEPWEKYVGLISGKIFSAFVDLRAGKNFGKKVVMTIDSKKAVFIPRGVANSFQVLEPNTYYSYLVNAHWSADSIPKYKYVNLSDPDLAIAWPISLESAIINDRDREYPFLKDIKPFVIIDS